MTRKFVLQLLLLYVCLNLVSSCVLVSVVCAQKGETNWREEEGSGSTRKKKRKIYIYRRINIFLVLCLLFLIVFVCV